MNKLGSSDVPNRIRMNRKLSEEKLVAFFYLQDEKSSGDSNV